MAPKPPYAPVEAALGEQTGEGAFGGAVGLLSDVRYGGPFPGLLMLCPSYLSCPVPCSAAEGKFYPHAEDSPLGPRGGGQDWCQ